MRYDVLKYSPVRRLLAALLLASAVVAPSLIGAADPVITSRWRTDDLVVDGSTAGWPRLERVGTGPSVAVQNDATTLHLVVASNDVTLREQLATGLVVWIDPTSRKAQTFGIRLEGLVRRTLPGTIEDPNAKAALERNLLLNTLVDVDLLGPGQNQRRLIEDASRFGLALASGVEAGTMVYELAIPLERSESTPYAPGLKPGATIALGIETPANPRMSQRRDRLEDPMNTNPWVVDPYGYGAFFAPPPPPGGRPSPPKEVVIKPMKLMWTTVRLAARP